MSRPSLDVLLQELQRLCSEGYAQLTIWREDDDGAEGGVWSADTEYANNCNADSPYEAIARAAEERAEHMDEPADADALRALATRCREPAPPPAEAARAGDREALLTDLVSCACNVGWRPDDMSAILDRHLHAPAEVPGVVVVDKQLEAILVAIADGTSPLVTELHEWAHDGAPGGRTALADILARRLGQTAAHTPAPAAEVPGEVVERWARETAAHWYSSKRPTATVVSLLADCLREQGTALLAARPATPSAEVERLTRELAEARAQVERAREQGRAEGYRIALEEAAQKLDALHSRHAQQASELREQSEAAQIRAHETLAAAQDIRAMTPKARA